MLNLQWMNGVNESVAQCADGKSVLFIVAYIYLQICEAPTYTHCRNIQRFTRSYKKFAYNVSIASLCTYQKVPMINTPINSVPMVINFYTLFHN